MRRIYEPHAYGPGPVEACWWDRTVRRPEFDGPLTEEARADVAIVGAGYTGLSAALHLAQAGARVVVVEAGRIAFGASGRNGGFCCLGGAKASDGAILRRFGSQALDEWNAAQREAIALVQQLLQENGIEADVHSRDGEVMLAHRPRDLAALRDEQAAFESAHGLRCELLTPSDLASRGMASPAFHGGLLYPMGFALNPLKYALGLARAARRHGAILHEDSPVLGIERQGDTYRLRTQDGCLVARRLIVATNGYSSEDVPPWMAGRYLPAQSAILVTRQLTESELSAQGWTTDLMAYDTRNLLHYFRLMPDRRFLFGMRGGVLAGPAAQARMRAMLRRDFERMFPAWARVETSFYWSGLVCLSRDLLPHVGPIGDWPSAWAGFAYHGNGVAMGTFAGRLLADLALGRGRSPTVMAAPARPIPGGAWRRLVLPVAYAWYGLRDRF